MSVLSGIGRLASPARAIESTGYVEFTGDELIAVARRKAAHADSVNVGGQEWSEKIQTGTVIRQCQNGDCDTFISYPGGPVNCSVQRKNGVIVGFSGDCALIKAARHTLDNAKKLTAVSYLLPSGEVIYHHEYSEPVESGNLKSEGAKQAVEGEEAVVVSYSANGQSSTLESEGEISTASHCGGCTAFNRR